jgi:hypothetical protein
LTSIFDSNLVLLRHALIILRQVLLVPLVVLELVIVHHVAEQRGVLMTTQEVTLGNITLMLVFRLCRLGLLLVLRLRVIVLSYILIMLLVFLVCEQNCRAVKLRQVIFVSALI